MERFLDFESIKRRHPAIKLGAFIYTTILAGIALAATGVEILPRVDAISGSKVFLVSLCLIAVIVLAFIGICLSADRKLDQLTLQVQELQRGSLPKDSHQRYEEIEEKKITLGWIRFHPTLRLKEGTNVKQGPGPAILISVFDGRIKWYPTESDWSNVIDGLITHKFDVVATPMYDIKERREQVEFTTPIFYADIGIFVAKDNKKIQDALHGERGLLFPRAIHLLQQIERNLKLCVHTGELQDKMISKYLPGATIKRTNIDEFSISAALDTMVDEDEEFESDLYFCERIQGEGHPSFGSELVNILAPGQLLFPVAFAIRKGDDTLRKFINLRLMTIDGENDSGIKRALVDNVGPILSPAMLARADEYFLRRRLLTPEEKKVIHLRNKP